METEQNYVYGTAAKKIQYDVYEENHVLKSKKKARSNGKAKFKTVLYILAVFSVFLFIMFRYAVITEMNYNLNKINKKYETLQKENSRLKVTVENEMDLNKIKAVAETELGMHSPDKYQTVYIKVPKVDYTKVADTGKKAGNIEKSIFSSLTNTMEKLASLLN